MKGKEIKEKIKEILQKQCFEDCSDIRVDKPTEKIFKLFSQEKQKSYNKGLDTKFSDIDFKGTREAIRKEAIKEVHILIAGEIIIAIKEKQPTSRLTSLAVKLEALTQTIKKGK